MMIRLWLSVGWVALGLHLTAVTALPAARQKQFADFCQQEFLSKENCPLTICKFELIEDAEGQVKPFCVPRPCPEIRSLNCPKDFCTLMTNCSNEQTCHYQMDDPPLCGDLAYAGQDVPCCEGLIQRCGVDFLDRTCDMEGKNSVYALPICIPCGDGVCVQFENPCNCPEDCGAPLSDKSLPIIILP
jgi:hypothetical protein